MRLIRLIIPFVLVSTAVSAQSYIPEQANPLVKVKPGIPIKAYAFPLKAVTLQKSPFRKAMSLDSAYLLSLKPDRLLYRFYKHAGLPVKDSIYGGWESDGLSGHTLGHYLSAMSMMYVSTRNPAFRNRVAYVVKELKRCQIARKTGYVGAIPNEDTLFAKVSRGDIKTGGFDLNGGWSPWYTVHKVMAGLCDAYLYTDNKEALSIVVGMADWTYTTVNHLSDSLRLKMLNCEYGGMNDVLANIYAFTGNKKYLDLSYKFYDEFVMGKLAQRIDPLPGKHSNTNVPKAIGSARQYELTGNERDKTIASFFWETMVHHHSYVIGGNSNYEYCGKADSLSDRLSDNTCETCNTYNMLKLTRHLFAWSPDSKLMDYYERALYNHILASQNPADGMMCYFVPLRMGTQKQFSDPFNTFTCCVGSGIENHSKYAEQIYSHNGKDKIWVNLFIPSSVNWNEKGISIQQETAFPKDNNVYLQVKSVKPQQMTIAIRIPDWVKGDVSPLISIGKKTLVWSESRKENGYVYITQTWSGERTIIIQWPMSLYTEAMPDNPNRIAFKYGPLVLAGLLGKDRPDPVIGVPVLLTANRNVSDWLVKEGPDLRFRMKEVGKPMDVELVPFHTVYDQYYSVYWDYFTPDAWSRLQAEYEAEKKREKALEERTIDYFRIGEMQPERDHNLVATEKSYVDDALGRKGREARANNYFSFEMPVDPAAKNSLILTYLGDDKDRKFDILVNGQLLQTVDWKGGRTGKFYDQEYALPASITNGQTKLTIKIDARYGKTAGRVFGARMIRTP